MKHYKTMLREFLPPYVEAIRENRNFSQEEMSEQLHITPRAYNNLKQGRFCFSIVPLVFLLLMLDGEEMKIFLDGLRGKVDALELIYES